MTQDASSVDEYADPRWGTCFRLSAPGYGSLEVAPGAGFQILRHRAKPPHGRHGERLDLMLPPPPEADPRGGFKSGNPILFPFPNRVRDARYTFRGRGYRLPANGQHGHHIHGLVYARPWQVAAAGRDARGAFITGAVEGTPDEPLDAGGYPFPVRLTVTYRLHPLGLTMEAEVLNTGDQDLPMGFGIHPYFCLPLAPDGDRRSCSVRVPARAVWELDDELLPTGRTVPARGALDLHRGRPLADAHYDHVFGELLPEPEPLVDEAGWSRCLLDDPAAGCRLVVAADAAFQAWVVYAPAGRPTICFEPYSCVTDAVNLEAAGLRAGLVALAPGRRWAGRVLIYLAPLPGHRRGAASDR